MEKSENINKKDLGIRLPKIVPLDPKEMGKRLKEVRKTNKMSQKKVEALTNLPQSSLSKFENGKQLIPCSYLCVLAKVYNVSTDYLIFGIYPEKYDDSAYNFCYQLSNTLISLAFNNLIKISDKNEVIINANFNQFNSAKRSECLSSYNDFAAKAYRIQNSRDLLGEDLFETRLKEDKDKFLFDIEKLNKESG